MYDSGSFKVESKPHPPNPPISTSSPGANVPWIVKGLGKLSFAINIKYLVGEKYNLSRKTLLSLTETWSSHSTVSTRDSGRQMMKCICPKANMAAVFAQGFLWSAAGGRVRPLGM